MANNTIAQNHCVSTTMTSYGAGLTIAIGASASGTNNILYGNTAMYYPDLLGTPVFTYSCCSQAMAGTGNITSDPLFVSGPSGSCYLSQIAAGQTQQSPCVDAGNPGSTMIAGTTRTDEIQDAGVIDMGHHYPVAPSFPSVTITMIPVSPPIQIPPGGGSFDYNISVVNNEAVQEIGDVWCMVTLPNGNPYGPVLGPFNLTMPVGFNTNRDRTQAVPGSAPSGTYTYHGYVGGYPSTIWDEDSFTFEKLTAGDGLPVDNWANYGEEFSDWSAAANNALIPDVYSLIQNYPNPFNPLTSIRYGLPEAGYVKLAVYDLLGRQVELLVNGWREAGTHEVVFHGSGLSPGIYICRLQAGEFTASSKMVVVK